MTTLTTLGGSAAGVGTGQGCSGYLVEHDGTRVVLDLGPDTLLELRKHTDIRALTAIVISHLHMDHILDLFALRYTLAYSPVPLPAPVPLWLPPGGLAFFDRAAELFAWGGGAPADFFTETFSLAEYDPEAPLSIGGLTLSFQRTDHHMPCWAMRVHVPDGGDLLYTADVANGDKLTSFATGVRVVLSEATLPEAPRPGEQRAHPHLSAEEAGQLATRAGAQTLVLTHIWEEDDPERARAHAAAVFGGDLFVARPGVTVTWA